MSDETRKPAEQWPGVAVAYDFVLPSYTWMTTRLEATATRIQAVMTFAATITLGFPVLGQAANKNIAFDSLPFLLAVALFCLLMGFGIFARNLGQTWLISPAKIYEGSLHLSEWEFKRDAIYFAGECFSHNAALADRKATLGSVMGWLLLCEVVSFLLWIGGVHLPMSVLWVGLLGLLP